VLFALVCPNFFITISRLNPPCFHMEVVESFLKRTALFLPKP
jgi:hypothetical protein